MMPRLSSLAALLGALALSGCGDAVRNELHEELPVLATTPCRLDPAATVNRCVGIYNASVFADGATGRQVRQDLLQGNAPRNKWAPELQGGGNKEKERRAFGCAPGDSNCDRVLQSVHTIVSSNIAEDLSNLKGAYVMAAIRVSGPKQGRDALYGLEFDEASSFKLDREYLFVAKPLPAAEVVPPDANGRPAVARLEIYGIEKQGPDFALRLMNGPDVRYIRRCDQDGYSSAPDAEFKECPMHSAPDSALVSASLLSAFLLQREGRSLSWDYPAWFTCAAGCCYGDFSF